ncbi:glycosyltransferase family 1 protein [Aeromonas media]|uniref:Glycosyltransferase family 1 protein n=1 Tax=Aeromonas media TaxID=651 RepID=A0AAE7DQ12_AERME|nr:glycosyltransferase [Aeromonas media]QJT30073.1 glycosyltransferase family 1 protein [Aeromonas media]
MKIIKSIVVNATALATGGALTILRQFVSHASLTNNKYIIFTPSGTVLDSYPNITYIEVDTSNWLKRIWWDIYGLKKHIKQHKIDCTLCISLQNTSINIDCEQLIYLHQSLPFTTVKYSVSNKTYKFFLYKWFYKFFIFLFATNTTRFVVQTQWMKTALLNSGILETQVSVFTPDITLPTGCDVGEANYYHSNLNSSKQALFFYPASSLFYKNHLLLLDALAFLKGRHLNKTPMLAVTFEQGSYPTFDAKAKQLSLVDNIVYLGVIPYEQVIQQYIMSDAVLFPSYIETFGLPLAEAGVLGKKIICADLPYSRDVLGDFQGVTFLDYQNAYIWAEEMAVVIESQSMSNFPPLSFQQRKTWQDFFAYI